MAINIDTLTLPITPEDALHIVQRHTQNLGVFLDLDRIYEIHGLLMQDNRDITREMRQVSGVSTLNTNDKESVLNTMFNLGVDRRDLLSGGELAFNTTTRAAVFANPDLPEDARKFAELYTTFTSNKNRIGTLQKSYETLPVCKVLSFNKHRMVLARPQWHLLSTSRLQAYDPGIQGLARQFGDVITHPPGYILIRCDSSQIEPRINFSYFVRDELIIDLIAAYNDAYFGIMHYCLMSDSEERACREYFEHNFHKIEVTEEMQENRQNTKTLVNAGSYGSSNLDRVNPRLASAFDRKLVHHPKRLALEREVAEICAADMEPTFYSAFGTPITPDETTKYKKGTKAWEGHLVRCGINNPVQATASDLMICSVNAANNLLSKYKDSGICYYKHDEGAFLVKEDDAANSDLVEQLSDITAYNVKGWIPIPAEPIIGVKKPSLPSYL